MIARLTPARLRDAAPLARVLADWHDETPWMPNGRTTQEDSDFLRNLIQRSEVIAVRSLGKPLGFMARDDAEIHALYLRPGLRGRGYGRRLLDHAKARSVTLKLWTFQANAGARQFYAREGFREEAQTDGSGNDEKLPDVRLVWAKDEAGK